MIIDLYNIVNYTSIPVFDNQALRLLIAGCCCTKISGLITAINFYLDGSYKKKVVYPKKSSDKIMPKVDFGRSCDPNEINAVEELGKIDQGANGEKADCIFNPAKDMNMKWGHMLLIVLVFLMALIFLIVSIVLVVLKLLN